MARPAAGWITLVEAVELLPRNRGKKVHLNTLRRWIAKGCRGVRLAAWRVGGRWYTTPEALDEFCQQCSTSTGRPMSPSLAAIRADGEAARRLLAQQGFYGRRKQLPKRLPKQRPQAANKRQRKGRTR